ncbi:winged helix-turn-helix domain-containing protein [Caulobacter endophyticus]|uniref:winged helix-turn-helix domain-containing protein n=1 Tax=Caulobacter endophyticus TaxID=2172652 RepID=UPI003D678552
MVSILDVLRMFGGGLPSGRISEIMIDLNLARPSDVAVVQPSGETRFAKEIRFARLELVAAGLLDCPESGFWALSDDGWSTLLTVDDARAIVTARRHDVRTAGKGAGTLVQGPTTGPAPGSYTAVISYDAEVPSFVYVLQFGSSDVWKVGRAKDVSVRLRQINKHVPFEILDQNWWVFAKVKCASFRDAHFSEQFLLSILESSRTVGERIRCPQDKIVDAWRRCLAHTTMIRFRPDGVRTTRSECFEAL